MDYFITVVGLLIFNIGEHNHTFYVKWDDVQAFETEYTPELFWKLKFTLKDNMYMVFTTFDDEFWDKLIKDLNSQMMTEVMWNDKQAKVEVNCEK